MPEDFFPSLKPASAAEKKETGKPRQHWKQQLAFAEAFSQALGTVVDKRPPRP